MNMGESVVLEKNENYWDAENVTLDKTDLPLHSGYLYSTDCL